MRRISRKFLFLLSFIGLGLVVLLMKNYVERLDIRSNLFSDHLLSSTKIDGESFPITLTDPVGETYLLKQVPQRIVSVTLGTDEILSALLFSSNQKASNLITTASISKNSTDSKGLAEQGLSLGNIVAVTRFVDEPSSSSIPNFYPKTIKRVSGGIEEILALEPDLAFVAGYTRAETVRLLLGAGIPVVRLTHYDTFEQIKQNIKLVAAVTGTSEKAKVLLRNLDAKLIKIQEKIHNSSRPRVLFYNLSGYTSGAGTRIDETISIAGGYNVLHDTGIEGNYKISDEMAIGLEPDIILLTGNAVDEHTSPAKMLMSRSAWQNVPAVLNQRVYQVSGPWILSVSHYGWDGIEILAKLIHPEVFD